MGSIVGRKERQEGKGNRRDGIRSKERVEYDQGECGRVSGPTVVDARASETWLLSSGVDVG